MVAWDMTLVIWS